MTLRLNGSTSGYTEIDAPAVAGSNTLLLPTGAGSAYQVVRNGATAGSLEFTDKIVSGTAVASTSGTSIDFTGIPSWVKRVTVMLNGVSVSGTSRILMQLGQSSGFLTTGYIVNTSSVAASANTTVADTTTSGFALVSTQQVSSSALFTGKQELAAFGTNIWVGSGLISSGNGAGVNHNAGNVTLSGALDRVRITTVNGTDTFDAGSINILME